LLFITESGITQVLDLLLSAWNTESVSVHLFQNNVVPSFSTTLADFIESNFQGYSPVAVSAWVASGFIGNVGYMTATSPTEFNVTGSSGPPQLAYGYWVQDGFGNLLWAEADPSGPINMSYLGNQYLIYPRLGLSNCPP